MQCCAAARQGGYHATHKLRCYLAHASYGHILSYKVTLPVIASENETRESPLDLVISHKLPADRRSDSEIGSLGRVGGLRPALF